MLLPADRVMDTHAVFDPWSHSGSLPVMYQWPHYQGQQIFLLRKHHLSAIFVWMWLTFHQLKNFCSRQEIFFKPTLGRVMIPQEKIA